VLRQKCDLGLLDPGRPGLEAAPANGANGEVLDLDPPGHRALARRLAEESVVLLANRDAALPLHRNARIAVTGPLADDPLAFYGCYSMPRHLGGRYPEAAEGPPSATVLAALRAELPAAQIDYAAGCAVREADRSGFAHAAAHAREADVVVAVLGDEAGLFGRGTWARAVTWPTCGCRRAGRPRCGSWLPRAPRWCWCWSPGGPTRSARWPGS
jgi:beta-xylosidase